MVDAHHAALALGGLAPLAGAGQKIGFGEAALGAQVGEAQLAVEELTGELGGLPEPEQRGRFGEAALGLLLLAHDGGDELRDVVSATRAVWVARHPPTILGIKRVAAARAHQGLAPGLALHEAYVRARIVGSAVVLQELVFQADAVGAARASQDPVVLIRRQEGRVDAELRQGGRAHVQLPAPLGVPQAFAGQLYVGGLHLVQLVKDQEVGRHALHARAAVGPPEVDGTPADLLEAGRVGVAHQGLEVLGLPDRRAEAVPGELTDVVVGREVVDDAAAMDDAEVHAAGDGVLARPHLGGLADGHEGRLVAVDPAQILVALQAEGPRVDPAPGPAPVS